MKKNEEILKCSEYRGTGGCQRKVDNETCRGYDNGGKCCGKFEDLRNPPSILEKSVVVILEAA